MWDPETEVLHWVGIEDQALHRLLPDGSWHTDHVPDRPGCVVLDEAGRRVVAFPSGIYVEGDGWSPISSICADRDDARLNDGKVAPDGRLVVGEMLEGSDERDGRLWAVSADGTSRLLRDDVTISNGLAWSADGVHFFYIDTPSRRIRRYDWVSEGRLGDPTEIVRVPNEAGFPDGMAVDDEGCLWVALWNGRGLHRYTPNGVLDTRIEVPTSNVTSCAFGGPDATTLFITTANESLPDEPQAHPGGLFAVDPGVSGPSPTRFGS